MENRNQSSNTPIPECPCCGTMWTVHGCAWALVQAGILAGSESPQVKDQLLKESYVNAKRTGCKNLNNLNQG